MAGLFCCIKSFSKKENKNILVLEFSQLQATIDYALAHLSWVRKPDLPDSTNLKLKALQFEFRFLKMFICCYPQWDCDPNLHFTLTSILTTTEAICSDFCCKWMAAIEEEDFAEWYLVAAKLEDKIHEFKAEINKYSEHFISCPLKSDLFTRNDTVKFLDFIHGNLNDLIFKCQADDEFAPVRTQIKEIEETLFLLRGLIDFTPIGTSGENNEESSDFRFFVHDWASNATRLTLMRLLNEEEDEETKEKLKGLYADMLQKANPCTPEFIRLCFGVFKDQRLSSKGKVPMLLRRSDTLIVGEFLSRFADFFLENLVLTLKDDVPMIREGLILLITFLVDPPSNTMNHSKLSFIRKQIYAVLDQASHTICLFSETSMDLTRGKTAVVNLQKSIDEVREKIEKLYVHIPLSLWSNFPRINGLGYFESLLVYLENLEDTMNKNKKLVPFLKHQIFKIKEELMPLRPLLQDIWKMQNKHEEVKDLWEQIISISYQADLVIKSSFFIDHPIWYNLTSMSFVVQKIKNIQLKVMRIKDSHICRTEIVPPLKSPVDVLKAPTSTSIVEVVVGFKHDTEVLIDRLTRGTVNLDIVPIVGMGGIGKTTLAKKLFNEPSIRYHFHKRAFCSVSQDYKKRNVLLDILSDLCKIDDKVRQMSDDDLAHMLKKCLSGCKYLVVMDDMWEIHAWNDMRTSFPDNNNGSRIIFTSRISNIALIGKPDSSPHLLPFLSIDESWELLKQKIFHKDPCPPHLCKVGKLIAEKCQGLPLAIVVIAGLLTRTERSLPQWNEVADALTSYASSEGCKDVIRFSYNQLSEALKSCFLYLGAFCEDEILDAKRLSKLWIAEGFVLKSESNCCLRKVAKQYLNELGDRNLVNVLRRSCNDGVKLFRVHDLIRDFCRSEAEEQHYLCFVNFHNSKLSIPTVCDQYRVFIEDVWRSFVDSKPRGPTVHSLLRYSKHYCEEKSLESFLCNFKLVQVLDLQMLEFPEGFPLAVTTLVHLRYLALQPAWSATWNVPMEISNLWNLETLLLMPSATEDMLLEVVFPNDIWKMKRLRHVEAGYKAHVALDDGVTGNFSLLPDLDSITSLVIPPGTNGEELLRRLSNVRKLSCLFGGCNQIPKLDILRNLESLHMVYSGEGFCYPHTFSYPSTIRKLTLESFELRWNEFSAVIQKLTSLQNLALYMTLSSDHGKIWDVQDDEFPSIRSLTLSCYDIQEWKASIDSFPCLEELHLFDCPDLIEIPPCFGEVPTLKSILVLNCKKEVADSAIQIRKHQFDSGNENLEVVSES